MGDSKVVKPIQFLTSFAMQHIENTFDAQDGEVVIEPPDDIRRRFYLFGYLVNHFFHHHTFVR
jgi:hypothetical protein